MVRSVDDSIEEEPLDKLVTLLRVGLGVVPGVGSILSELIGTFIPNQRIERIKRFLQELELRINQLEISKEDLQDPLSIDLIEDGAFQAIRALSDQRIRLISTCVAEGIKAPKKERLSEKRILYIISQLDEGDAVLLFAFNSRSPERFADIAPPIPTVGSDDHALNEKGLYEASVEKLARLSLLRFSIHMEKQAPTFDRITGKQRGHYHITSLGRTILKRAELQ